MSFEIPGCDVVPMVSGVLVDTGDLSDPSEIDMSALAQVYHQFGAVLIGGLHMDKPRFVALTNAFGAEFLEYRGGADNDRQSAMDGQATVLTVTGGAVEKKAIPLHGEMYYTARRPAVLYFCCLTPVAEGGHTTICDGVALWAALPTDLRQVFLDQKLTYTRHMSSDQWTRVYKTDDLNVVERLCAENATSLKPQADGSIVTEFTTPATIEHAAGTAFVNSLLVWVTREVRGGRTDSLVRFEDGTQIPLPMMRTIYRTAREITQEIDWQSGDVAIVDNSRVMHGRTGYEDPSRDIIMRLGAEQIVR